MAIDRLDPSLFNEPIHAPARHVPAQPELLVSAVLHLMSHYTASPHEAPAYVKLAAVIERHLNVLADLPELAPVLRATCRQLSEQWAVIVERTLPQPRKPNLFARLVANTRL